VAANHARCQAEFYAEMANTIERPDYKERWLRLAKQWQDLAQATEPIKDELWGAYEWPRHHLASAAAATMLLLTASAFAADEIARDDVCTGSKPFREIAQDETRSMAELCRMQEEFLRGDRGWQDTPAYARGHGEGADGQR
jgi:hypothetical protein